MDSMNQTLICFTASYPYGKAETYFENELLYLADHFDKVVIIPTYNPYGNVQRKVPDNVTVFSPSLEQSKFRFFRDFLYSFNLNKLFVKEFIKRDVYKNKSKLKSWFLTLVSHNAGLKKFRKYKFDADTSVLYSYWAGKSFFFEKELSKYLKVVRMHGGDFYEERNSGYLPLRKYIYDSANVLLPISMDIQSILEGHYRINPEKIRLSYLGVRNTSTSCELKNDSILEVVSCSNVYKLKRINLIIDILRSLSQNYRIHWTHIGDGPLLSDVKNYFSSLENSNFTASFLGQKTQEEIANFYEMNYVDFFINTSEYEGLPVSIMEAFSYGIPAVATNVGGTREIVNETNGILIDKEFNPVEISKEIMALIETKGKQHRINAYETWLTKFNADENYKELAILLKTLN